MTNTIETKDMTGVATPTNGIQNIKHQKIQQEVQKEKEYNVVASILEAANFRNDKTLITKVDIKRGDKYFFTVHLRPISDQEMKVATKKATKMVPNPNNHKLPKIEGDFDNSVFNSWLIYLSSTEEDQNKIWGNPEIMEKLEVLQAVDSIDQILTLGEKVRLADTVVEISGLDVASDEELVTEEDYAKNL